MTDAKQGVLVAVNTQKNVFALFLYRLMHIRPLLRSIWLAIIILVLVLSSQLSLYEKPILGVYITAFAFACLVAIALASESARKLAISAAILPIATMINLSLPQTSLFAQLVVYYDGLLVLGLVYRFMFTLDEPVKNTRLGIKGYIFALPLMIIIGQLLGTIGFLFLKHQYAFHKTSLPLVAVATAVFAISEEVVFQGLIQHTASKVLHPITAAVMTAALYTSLSFGHHGSYLTPLFALIMGIVLAATYYKKPNLILAIGVNITAKLAYIGLLAGFVFR
jgi:membrane protease YdiL (CAAX protease family)